MHINSSGVVLSPYPGPGITHSRYAILYKTKCWTAYNTLSIGGVMHTEMVILMQVAVFGALHRMLKGAYNSGELHS